MIRPKLCENCAFPQNFHIRKLGEIRAFYAVEHFQGSVIISLDFCWLYFYFISYLVFIEFNLRTEVTFSQNNIKTEMHVHSYGS